MLIVCQTTRNYHPSDIYPRCINDSYVYRCYTPVKIALDGPAVVCSSYLNTQPSVFSISGLSRSVLIFSRGFERIPRNLSRFKVSQVAAILRSLPFDSHRWRRLQGPLLAGLRERERYPPCSAVEVEPKAPGELPPNFGASLIPQSSSNDSASRHVITMGLSGAALDVDSRLSISLHDLSLGLRAPAKFRSIRCFFFWGKVEVNRAILLLIQQLVKRLLFLRGSKW